MLIAADSAFSQQTNPSPALTKQDYLKKSKNQKIVAFSLAGGGIVVWLAGVSKYMDQDDNVDGGGEAAMVIGGVSPLASIPFFIASSKNKKKAMRISFKIQTVPHFQNSSFVYRRIPSLALKIE